MIKTGILFEDAIAEFEKQFILRVMERHHGNLSKASAELRIHRNTLRKRLQEYGGRKSLTGLARTRLTRKL
ncbi:MAG: helix-turn-helix domain-containing protein [Acidobacteriota bacterium]